MPETPHQASDRPGDSSLGRFVGVVRITRADGRIEDQEIEIPITPAMLSLDAPQPDDLPAEARAARGNY